MHRKAHARTLYDGFDKGAGGANRDRTGDLLLAKQALSQLSYGPDEGQTTFSRETSA